LTERNTDVAHTFEEGNQLATFNFGDVPDFIEKCQYYMAHPKERLEIARRGWEWSKDWSWDQQMEKQVRFINGEDVDADGAAGEYVGTYSDPG
jgi:spore maturation protein CgeB